MTISPVAEAFPVGELLADELEARGLTRAEFAEILGRPPQFVSEILSGKKELTRESAAQIGAALGTSAELWLNLQDTYHLWVQGRDEHVQEGLDEVRLRARLAELAPVAILRKRGYLTGETSHEQASELVALFGMRDLEDEPDLVLAARRSNADDVLTSIQTAWVACVRAEAREIPVGSYSKEGAVQLAARLSSDLSNLDRLGELPSMFAAVGVRVVYVEAFPGSKIDGCALLVDGVPTIGVSGRGHRVDKVLFTLLHELAHVVLGHLEEGVLVLDDEADPGDMSLEGAANDQAARWMLPTPLPPPPDRVDADWVRRAARDVGVPPIVIVGRLQYEGRLSWRTALVRGAPNAVEYLRRWRTS